MNHLSVPHTGPETKLSENTLYRCVGTESIITGCYVLIICWVMRDAFMANYSMEIMQGFTVNWASRVVQGPRQFKVLPPTIQGGAGIGFFKSICFRLLIYPLQKQYASF